MPKWLKILLVAVVVVVAGPPLLGAALAALGIAIGVSVGLLKLAVLGLGIWCVVMLLKGLFGGPPKSAREERLAESVDSNVQEIAHLDASRRALDEELDRAIADARK